MQSPDGPLRIVGRPKVFRRAGSFFGCAEIAGSTRRRRMLGGKAAMRQAPVVCAWADQSGNGWLFVDQSSTLPTLAAVGVGGQPAISLQSWEDDTRRRANPAQRALCGFQYGRPATPTCRSSNMLVQWDGRRPERAPKRADELAE